jgi:hypothetical protein
MVAGTVVARERHDACNTILDIDAAADAFLAAHAGSAPAATTPMPAMPAATNIQTSEYSITVNKAASPTAVADPREAALLALLDAQDMELLHEFMTRRNQLQAAPRERLAHSVARRLTARFDQPMPPLELIEPF